MRELAQPYSWRQFSRHSVVAPVRVHIHPLEDDSSHRIGYLARSVCIAYASIQALPKTPWIEAALGETRGDAFEIRQLAPSELQAAGIDAPQTDGHAWFYIQMNLLQRVVIRGVVEVEAHVDEESVHVLWAMAPQFSVSPAADDQPPATLVNSWALLQREATGQTAEGPPHPYQGMGGCLFVMQTGLEDHQAVVESFWVLHEPVEWFAGSNQLRSKLPLMLQENARELRRRLGR